MWYVQLKGTRASSSAGKSSRTRVTPPPDGGGNPHGAPRFRVSSLASALSTERDPVTYSSYWPLLLRFLRAWVSAKQITKGPLFRVLFCLSSSRPSLSLYTAVINTVIRSEDGRHVIKPDTKAIIDEQESGGSVRGQQAKRLFYVVYVRTSSPWSVGWSRDSRRKGSFMTCMFIDHLHGVYGVHCCSSCFLFSICHFLHLCGARVILRSCRI